MGGKRPCIGAACDGSQNRRIHFQVAIIIFQDILYLMNDFGAEEKGFPYFRIYDQINVSLSVSCVLILQSVEFVRQDLEGF